MEVGKKTCRSSKQVMQLEKGRRGLRTLLVGERACVITFPSVELAPVVVKVGNTSDRTVAEFEEFGLTPLAAKLASSPMIDECYADTECQVVDTCLAEMYNIFVLEDFMA